MSGELGVGAGGWVAARRDVGPRWHGTRKDQLRSGSVWGAGRAGEEVPSSTHCLYGVSPGGGGAGLGCRGGGGVGVDAFGDRR